MIVKNKNKATQVGLLLSYYIVLSFWAAQTLGMSMISRNIAGQTKKTVVVAANFVAWSTGNAIGEFLLLPCLALLLRCFLPLIRTPINIIRPAGFPRLG
jgi:hypothetical protein